MAPRATIAAMTRTFLLQVTDAGLLGAEFTNAGRAKFIPAWAFSSWDELGSFFQKIGATTDELDRLKQAILPTGIAQLVIQNAAAE